MVEFWNKFGLLLFIIGVVNLWGNYSIDSDRWLYGCFLIIGALLNLMPIEYYQKFKKGKEVRK